MGAIDEAAARLAELGIAQDHEAVLFTRALQPSPLSASRRVSLVQARIREMDRLAAIAAKKQARKDQLKAAREIRTAEMWESSCGHVEQTGNPRRNCNCGACTRRRAEKTAQQKARRRGTYDPTEWYTQGDLHEGQPNYREERFAKYSITEQQYMEMLAAQDYSCAICGTKRPGRNNSITSWAVDHDHSCCPGDRSCGECIRGLLCGNCNTMLGMAQDKPSRLDAAAAYLRRHGHED